MTPAGNRSEFIAEEADRAMTYGREGGLFLSKLKLVVLGTGTLLLIVLAAVFGRYVWAPGSNVGISDSDANVGVSSSVSQDSLFRTVVHPDDPIEHRLSREVLPTRYRLHVWPVLDKAPANRTLFTFLGKVAISIHVSSSAGIDRLILHAAEALIIGDADVALTKSSLRADALADSWDAFPEIDHRIHIHTLKRKPTWDVMEVIFSGNLPPGMYTLFLRFSGHLGGSLRGFYRSSYSEANSTQRWLAVTHMQPTHAREAFPCLDEPGFRAPFQVSIARHESTSSISNAPLYKTTEIQDVPGWKWDHFEESVSMPTYLVAYAVMDFGYLTIEDDNPTKRELTAPTIEYYITTTPSPPVEQHKVAVKLWARSSVLERGRYAVELTSKILQYFANTFGVPYPLSKIDLLAIPDFPSGAMENWGLIGFRESNVLVDRTTADVDHIESVALTVAHELAHQWFGNLVTPSWWDELWLNEGFAQYLQFLAVDAIDVEPYWHATSRFQTYVLQGVLYQDASNASRALAARMHSEHDVLQAFDQITYDKGACLVRMLHLSLGDEVFRDGVSRYLKKWQHNSTTESRLWKPLTESVNKVPANSSRPYLPVNKSVADVMAGWTQSTGYPVVTVVRNYTSEDITFIQDRFLEGQRTEGHASGQLWFIPLSYASQKEVTSGASTLNDTRPRVWMTDRILTVQNVNLQPSEWILVNLQQAGFYRVNYDSENWNLLSNQLNNNHNLLPEATRSQLLDDAFALARVGLLPYPTALDLTKYMSRSERSLNPWQTALSGLNSIYIDLVGHPDLDLFQKYMRRLLESIWSWVAPAEPGSAQLSPSPETLNHEILLLRQMIASSACKVDEERCWSWATRAVHFWRSQPDPDSTNTVPVLMRSVAYCTAVRSGSSAVWDFLWQRYLRAKRDPVEQRTILHALACANDPAKIIFLLERSLSDEEIRNQDTDAVWSAAALNPIAGLMVFRFLKDNWVRIQERFGESSVVGTGVIQGAILGLSTEADLRDLELFRKHYNATLGAVSRTLDVRIQELKTIIAWRQRHLPTLREWLLQQLQQ